VERLTQWREALSELLKTQPLGVLCTHNDGQPYGSLVAVVATDDLRHILFATTRATRKYANLTADHRVGILIDNRSNEPEDLRLAMAATATGTAVELHGADRRQATAVYLRKHPQLAEFVAAPSCALMRIDVEKYYIVRHFQNVMELDVS